MWIDLNKGHPSFNPITGPARKVSVLRNVHACLRKVYFFVLHITYLFSILCIFMEMLLHAKVKRQRERQTETETQRKRPRKGIRISNVALLLAVFKQNHSSERVKTIFFFCNLCLPISIQIEPLVKDPSLFGDDFFWNLCLLISVSSFCYSQCVCVHACSAYFFKFYNTLCKSFCKTMIYMCIEYHI